MLTTLVASIALAGVGQANVTVSRVKTFPSLRTIAVAAAPTGTRFAASTEDGKVRIMDAQRAATVLTLEGHPQPVYGLAWRPDGKVLATGDESARIYLWNATTGKKIGEMPRSADGHQRGIQALSFSADGKRLASTGQDDMIIIWDAVSAKRVGRILGQGTNVLAGQFLPTGGGFVAASLGTGLKFYATNTFGNTANVDGHNGAGISDLAVNRAATRAVTAGRDNLAVLWDMKTRKRINGLRGHSDIVVRAAISPNGRLAATSSTDRTVIVWNLQNYKPVATIQEQSGIGSPVAFVHDGQFLVTAGSADELQIHRVVAR